LLKKLVQNPLGFGESTAFMGQVGKTSFSQTFQDQMGQVRDAIFR
jgi:hypothetical protein